MMEVSPHICLFFIIIFLKQIVVLTIFLDSFWQVHQLPCHHDCYRAAGSASTYFPWRKVKGKSVVLPPGSGTGGTSQYLLDVCHELMSIGQGQNSAGNSSDICGLLFLLPLGGTLDLKTLLGLPLFFLQEGLGMKGGSKRCPNQPEILVLKSLHQGVLRAPQTNGVQAANCTSQPVCWSTWKSDCKAPRPASPSVAALLSPIWLSKEEHLAVPAATKTISPPHTGSVLAEVCGALGKPWADCIALAVLCAKHGHPVPRKSPALFHENMVSTRVPR